MLQGDTLQLSLLSRCMEGIKLIYFFWSLIVGITLRNQGKFQLIGKLALCFIICAIFFFLSFNVRSGLLDHEKIFNSQNEGSGSHSKLPFVSSNHLNTWLAFSKCLNPQLPVKDNPKSK